MGQLKAKKEAIYHCHRETKISARVQILLAGDKAGINELEVEWTKS